MVLYCGPQASQCQLPPGRAPGAAADRAPTKQLSLTTRQRGTCRTERRRRQPRQQSKSRWPPLRQPCWGASCPRKLQGPAASVVRSANAAALTTGKSKEPHSDEWSTAQACCQWRRLSVVCWVDSPQPRRRPDLWGASRSRRFPGGCHAAATDPSCTGRPLDSSCWRRPSSVRSADATWFATGQPQGHPPQGGSFAEACWRRMRVPMVTWIVDATEPGLRQEPPHGASWKPKPVSDPRRGLRAQGSWQPGDAEQQAEW